MNRSILGAFGVMARGVLAVSDMRRARVASAVLSGPVWSWGLFVPGPRRRGLPSHLLDRARAGDVLTPSSLARLILRTNPCAYIEGRGLVARYTIDPRDPGFLTIDWTTAQRLRRYTGARILRSCSEWLRHRDPLVVEARAWRLIAAVRTRGAVAPHKRDLSRHRHGRRRPVVSFGPGRESPCGAT